MEFQTALFMIISLAATLEGVTQHQVKLTLPDNVVNNGDLYGQCVVDGKIPPRVAVLFDGKCDLKILKTEKNLILGYSQVDFVVKNVTQTCVYQCLLFRAIAIKTVSVAEAKISSPSNKTIRVIKNFPITINCTVTTNVHTSQHKLLWIKNNSFVEFDNHYTTWFSPSKNSTNIQHHYLAIHAVTNPAAYTCMLVSTSGKVVDSATQYIVVDEADSPLVLELLQYLSQHFKWPPPRMRDPYQTQFMT